MSFSSSSFHYPFITPSHSTSKVSQTTPLPLPGTPHVLHRRIAPILPLLLLLLQARHKWLMVLRLRHLPVQSRPRLVPNVHSILGRRRKMDLRDVRVRIAVFDVLS